jgi:arylsulfatase A-like enzyme
MRMIRTKKYKYVRHFKANFMDELYDLEADPGEQRNLLRRRSPPRVRKIAAGLQEQLTEWQKSIDDPLLKDGD